MPVCLCTRKFMAFFQISAITVVKSSLPFFTTKRGTCVRITSMMHKPSVPFRFIKSRLTFFKKSIYCCHYVISTTSQLSPEHASVCDPTVLSSFSYFVNSVQSISVGIVLTKSLYCSLEHS